MRPPLPELGRRPVRIADRTPQHRGAAQGLPAADTHGERATDRVSRLGLLGAPAPFRDRCHVALLRDHPCQRAPRRVRHRRGGHRALRAGQGGGRPFRRRARSGSRGRLHQEHHRGAQPGGPILGPGQPAGGRPRAPHRDGAPRQHRALDDPGRGARRPGPALHPDRRRRPPRPRRPRPPARRGQAGRDLDHVQRAGHHQSGPPGGRRGASRRCRRGGGRRAAGPPRPRLGDRAGCGLPGLLGPQDDGADRHRGALGQGGAPRVHGAVPGGRRDDPRRQAGLVPVGAPAGPLRGWVLPRSPRRSD